jgi:hypothetical protein
MKFYVAEGSSDRARGVILRFLKKNPTSLDAWLAAIHLETTAETSSISSLIDLTKQALTRFPLNPTLQSWMKKFEEIAVSVETPATNNEKAPTNV